MGSAERPLVRQRIEEVGAHNSGVTFRIARSAAALAARYHRATLIGTEHLPKQGPALVVANHGIFGLDTPVFFFLVHQATGRLPIGMADRILVRLPPMRAVLHEIGGVEGTRENARMLLERGQLVVCYPGGAREVFKGPGQRHRLAWERSCGFARVAAEAQVPVVPVAALGVDDTFRVVCRISPLARVLGHSKYAVPFAVGLGPLPFPSRFRFHVGPPMPPPPRGAREETLTAYRAELEARLSRQLSLLERIERDA